MYVIVRDQGYDGMSPPLHIVEDRDQAVEVLKHYEAVADGKHKMYYTPVWPELGTEPWYNRKAEDV